jgi:hypothetical protein
MPRIHDRAHDEEPMATLPNRSPALGGLLVGLACALALACAHGPGGDAKAPRTLLPDAQALSHGAPTLWQRFEAETGRPRLLILASPT